MDISKKALELISLEGKVAMISGAASGIGLGTAKRLAEFGAKVSILDINDENGAKAVKEIEALGGSAHYIKCDVRQAADCKNAADKTVEKFGRIDILVNNGGISQRALVKDADFEVIRQVMEINFFGTVALTKEVLPYMLSQKSGKIIVMSSLTGKFGAPLRSAYAASKHALHGFFDTLRAETIDDNIDILLVCPGYIKTNISINALKANGIPQNIMDDGQKNGMLPEVLAKKILRAISKNKKELITGGKEVLGVYIKRFFPNLFCKIIAKQK